MCWYFLIELINNALILLFVSLFLFNIYIYKVKKRHSVSKVKKYIEN